MRPCELGVAAAQTIATTAFSDGPHGLVHCVTDFAGNAGCTPDADGPDRQQRAGPPARAGARGRRRLAPGQRLRPRLGRPRPGGCQPDRRRLMADRRAGRVRHRRPVRRRPRHRAAAAPLGAPRRRLHPRLWLRDEAGNEAPGLRGLGSAAPRRRASRRGLRRRRRRRSRCDPRRRHRRALRARGRGDPLPPARRRPLDRAAGEARAGAAAPDRRSSSRRCPTRSAPGTYVFRADAVDAAGNIASTTRRADGTEMALRKRPRRAAERPAAGAVRRRPGSSPASAGAIVTGPR